MCLLSSALFHHAPCRALIIKHLLLALMWLISNMSCSYDMQRIVVQYKEGNDGFDFCNWVYKLNKNDNIFIQFYCKYKYLTIFDRIHSKWQIVKALSCHPCQRLVCPYNFTKLFAVFDFHIQYVNHLYFSTRGKAFGKRVFSLLLSYLENLYLIIKTVKH